jgi:outer membrane protein assembly factor BamB
MNRCLYRPVLYLVLIGAVLNFTAVLGAQNETGKGIAATDWPWWRGPSGTGTASPDQKPPMKWSATQNIIWKAKVPGRGHGSPTVVGEHVYLTIADRKKDQQSVMCFNRKSGKVLWNAVVHRGGIMKGNKQASQASTTVACDGERIYVNFVNSNAVTTTALNRKGKQLWQTKIVNYKIHQGYASSPYLYKSLVLISADTKIGGAVAGLDRATGKIVWKVDRPKIPNYSSPVVVQAYGRDQLIFIGCKLVSSLEPLTGKKIWQIKGSTEECVTTTVTDGKLVYSSGGWPKNHVAAIRADGSGEIVWQNKTRVYVPSMLIQDGYLYTSADEGKAICWKADTGKEMWQERINGTFRASPILVGKHIYATNNAGKTYIFKADPNKFELIGTNQLGDESSATMAICGSRIYTRVAFKKNGNRQEMLYCIGSKK